MPPFVAEPPASTTVSPDFKMSAHVSGRKAIFFLVAFALLLGQGFYFIKVTLPQRMQRSVALTQVADDAVVEVLVGSTRSTHGSTRPFIISDLEGIRRILHPLHSAKPFDPSHPNSQWECQLTIKQKETSWVANLVDTGDQGFYAFVEAGATLRNDKGFSELRDFLVSRMK